MFKNVANQVISAEMIYANGAIFDGTAICYVTKDGGNQTLGATANGVCTHKGNGEQEYKPSQAETNADYVKFTFTGSGALPAGIPVYTGVFADVRSINGSADSAATLQRAVDSTVKGTCAAGGSPTSIPTSACDPAGGASDQWAGRIITFDKNTTTAALRGQARVIQAASASATPTFTVIAMSGTPVSGDTFTVT